MAETTLRHGAEVLSSTEHPQLPAENYLDRFRDSISGKYKRRIDATDRVIPVE